MTPFLIRGFSISHVRSNRSDLINERNVSTPWPPLRPQLCPDCFIRAETRTFLDASTAPEPIGKPTLDTSAKYSQAPLRKPLRSSPVNSSEDDPQSDRSLFHVQVAKVSDVAVNFVKV